VKIGIVFPQADIGTDPDVIRAFARGAEDAGFDYLLAYDHITGVHPDRFAGATIPGFAGHRTCTTARSTSRSCSSRIWPG
jgi:hypothetical protein